MDTPHKIRLHQLVDGMSEEDAATTLAALRSDANVGGMARAEVDDWAERLVTQAWKVQDLRYGENPHQAAALYATSRPSRGIAGAQQLQGPPMSFTNLLDADAGMGIVERFERPAAAIVKHVNPCGFALADEIARAYELALDCDPRAAYGGVVALNRPLSNELAGALGKVFLNVVVTPGATNAAAAKLRQSLRLLIVDQPVGTDAMEVRSVAGGLLVQTRDRVAPTREQATVMTRCEPSDDQWRQLLTAWRLCADVKSNAVVIVRHDMAVGVGAGQMSRIEAAELAIARAGSRATGAVAGSDGLIPFTDVIDAFTAAGVEAPSIQVGASATSNSSTRPTMRIWRWSASGSVTSGIEASPHPRARLPAVSRGGSVPHASLGRASSA